MDRPKQLKNWKKLRAATGFITHDGLMYLAGAGVLVAVTLPGVLGPGPGSPWRLGAATVAVTLFLFILVRFVLSFRRRQ